MITITRNTSGQDAQSMQVMAFSYEAKQEPTTLEAFRTQLKEDLKAIGEIDWTKKLDE